MNECPYCGLEARTDYPLEFRCGSVTNRHRSKECMEKEIGLLKERVERLEAWGDRLEELLGDPPDANCSCHISPPCNDCVEWAAIREAKTEWNQAKETNP